MGSTRAKVMDILEEGQRFIDLSLKQGRWGDKRTANSYVKCWDFARTFFEEKKITEVEDSDTSLLKITQMYHNYYWVVHEKGMYARQNDISNFKRVLKYSLDVLQKRIRPMEVEEIKPTSFKVTIEFSPAIEEYLKAQAELYNVKVEDIVKMKIVESYNTQK